jgi:hypothetical protein
MGLLLLIGAEGLHLGLVRAASPKTTPPPGGC